MALKIIEFNLLTSSGTSVSDTSDGLDFTQQNLYGYVEKIAIHIGTWATPTVAITCDDQLKDGTNSVDETIFSKSTCTTGVYYPRTQTVLNSDGGALSYDGSNEVAVRPFVSGIITLAVTSIATGQAGSVWIYVRTPD